MGCAVSNGAPPASSFGAFGAYRGGAEMTPRQRRQRQERLQKHRAETLYRTKQEWDSTQAAQGDPRVEAQLDLCARLPIACVCFGGDGLLVHVNNAAVTLSGHGSGTLHQGNLVRKVLAGLPDDYTELLLHDEWAARTVCPDGDETPVMLHVIELLEDGAGPHQLYLAVVLPRTRAQSPRASGDRSASLSGGRSTVFAVVSSGDHSAVPLPPSTNTLPLDHTDSGDSGWGKSVPPPQRPAIPVAPLNLPVRKPGDPGCEPQSPASPASPGPPQNPPRSVSMADLAKLSPQDLSPVMHPLANTSFSRLSHSSSGAPHSRSPPEKGPSVPFIHGLSAVRKRSQGGSPRPLATPKPPPQGYIGSPAPSPTGRALHTPKPPGAAPDPGPAPRASLGSQQDAEEEAAGRLTFSGLRDLSATERPLTQPVRDGQRAGFAGGGRRRVSSHGSRKAVDRPESGLSGTSPNKMAESGLSCASSESGFILPSRRANRGDSTSVASVGSLPMSPAASPRRSFIDQPSAWGDILIAVTQDGLVAGMSRGAHRCFDCLDNWGLDNARAGRQSPRLSPRRQDTSPQGCSSPASPKLSPRRQGSSASGKESPRGVDGWEGRPVDRLLHWSEERSVAALAAEGARAMLRGGDERGLLFRDAEGAPCAMEVVACLATAPGAAAVLRLCPRPTADLSASQQGGASPRRRRSSHAAGVTFGGKSATQGYASSVPHDVAILLDNLAVPCILTNPHGVIEHWNPQCTDALGAPASAVLGRSVSCVVPWPHGPRHDALVRGAFEGRYRDLFSGAPRPVTARNLATGVVVPALLSLSECVLRRDNVPFVVAVLHPLRRWHDDPRVGARVHRTLARLTEESVAEHPDHPLILPERKAQHAGKTLSGMAVPRSLSKDAGRDTDNSGDSGESRGSSPPASPRSCLKSRRSRDNSPPMSPHRGRDAPTPT